MSILPYSLRVPSISRRTWGFVGQRPSHGEHSGASLSQFSSPDFHVALLARTNRQRSTAFCQRLGDGLSNLSVAAHRCYHGNFAFKTGRHVIQSDVCFIASALLCR